MGIAELKTLKQNWSDDEATRFYETAQGSKLIPLKWFLHLEQADHESLFREAKHVRELGYIPRTASNNNPEGLPVGFTKDGLHLGLSCAACHTSQVEWNSKAWIIDGGPTLGDFETLLRKLAVALRRTKEDEAKFLRFAQKVLGANASDAERLVLRSQLADAAKVRAGYNERNLPSNSPRFGPGRVDAFGAIMNEMASTFAEVPQNHARADAPVSYPFLWDTPQHDRVQWNGAAPNATSLLAIPVVGTKHVGALGRNAGEVMGVFGNIHVAQDGFLIPAKYSSTVNLPNLIDIEESLRKLWSPQWPEEFPKIDTAKRNQGEVLFKQNCAACHEDIERDNPDRTVTAWLKGSVGTDATMAKNFLTRQAKTGKFQGQRISLLGLNRFGSDAHVSEMLAHAVQRVLIGGGTGTGGPVPFELSAPIEIQLAGSKMIGRFHGVKLENNRLIAGLMGDQHSLNDLLVKQNGKTFKAKLSQLGDGTIQLLDAVGPLKLDGFSSNSVLSPVGSLLAFKDAKEVAFIYKARPLNGIWATAPYLHNGSVPNLDELLKKPTKRVQQFRVGSREFDPVHVGFRTDVGPFLFDTAPLGNQNIGHDYDVEFSAEQRLQLIEYLKSL